MLMFYLILINLYWLGFLLYNCHINKVFSSSRPIQVLYCPVYDKILHSNTVTCGFSSNITEKIVIGQQMKF